MSAVVLVVVLTATPARMSNSPKIAGYRRAGRPLPEVPAIRSRPLLVLAVLAAVLATSCGGGGGDPAAVGDRLLELGPDEAVAYVEDQQPSPVLLNVWGSWCPPCRDEAPTLVAAARRFGDEMVFLGIDLEDTRAGAAEFIEAFDVPFRSLFDPEGDIVRALGLRGIPVTVVLDADGTEVFRRIGSISEAELLAALQDVVDP